MLLDKSVTENPAEVQSHVRAHMPPHMTQMQAHTHAPGGMRRPLAASGSGQTSGSRSRRGMGPPASGCSPLQPQEAFGYSWPAPCTQGGLLLRCVSCNLVMGWQCCTTAAISTGRVVWQGGPLSCAKTCCTGRTNVWAAALRVAAVRIPAPDVSVLLSSGWAPSIDGAAGFSKTTSGAKAGVHDALHAWNRASCERHCLDSWPTGSEHGGAHMLQPAQHQVRQQPGPDRPVFCSVQTAEVVGWHSVP